MEEEKNNATYQELDETTSLVKNICYKHGRVMLHPDKCKECRHEGECIERNLRL